MWPGNTYHRSIIMNHSLNTAIKIQMKFIWSIQWISSTKRHPRWQIRTIGK